jgi:L,D-peptidoglycan transpeptidase YkuD (ErfK/YbiS/YcfS/YnhG family)
MAMMLITVTSDGILSFQDKIIRCALGKGGVTADKCEGDHKTPLGKFPLREVFIRPDRITRFQTHLPVTLLDTSMGWCDDPFHRAYNRPVTLPFDASHEKLWREDERYNIIIPLGYNDNPPIAGKGSAIFFHLASEDYQGTEGCVAISQKDMLELLPLLSIECEMEILN